MPRTKKAPIVLTDAQKKIIEERYFEPSDILLNLVFPGQNNLDLRSLEYRAVKEYLAVMPNSTGTKQKQNSSDIPEQGDKPVDDQQLPEIPDEQFEIVVGKLTDAQKEFIRNSYKDSNPLELAKTVFNNQSLPFNSSEVNIVSKYIREFDPNYRKNDREANGEYSPPKTIAQVAGRINEYRISTRGDGKKLYHNGTFSSEERRNLEATLNYMQLPVFKSEADKFVKQIDREVFESVFLSTCWDKPDLTAEHVIQYIMLASLTAQRNQADRMVRSLDDRFAQSIEDETKRLSKSEVDALNATKEKATEHLKQIGNLIKTLTGERAKLINERVAGASTLYPLVQAWKDETNRRRMIALAQKTNQAALKKEVERLSTMDSLKCELWGIDPTTITF